MRFAISTTAALLFVLSACGAEAPVPTAEASAPKASSETQPPSTPAQAATEASGDFAMVSSRGQQVGAANGAQEVGGDSAAEGQGGGTISGAGLSFDLPQTWQRQQPSSSMRMAQAAIPGSGGEGQLTVFFFGPGGGGGVDANLQRWIGQVVANPGETPKRDSFAIGNLNATWVELGGTLKASGMGTGPTTDQPNQRLFAAVVEGAGGPWFFKATGPEGTMAANREGFLHLLKSVRLGK
ncbi:MAG: hypothetical protein K0U98_16210 [Deltaproteobacteria bacterium]|nr:hypothetical protein [Deltaproteobacteria bacterium]